MSSTSREPARITEGVFFTSPPPLPRGKHTLSRDEVTEAHRQRLCIAVTELLAHGGYRGVGVKEVCARASVSLAAFYACFETKDDAIFAAYDRFIEVLVERLVSEPAGSDWDDYVLRMMSAYLHTLAADVVVGRAFQVEMDALGKVARDKRREALQAMAEVLQSKHAEFDPEAAAQLPMTAYVAAVYGVRQLAADRLELDDPRRVDELVGEISLWVGRTFGGRTSAG